MKGKSIRGWWESLIGLADHLVFYLLSEISWLLILSKQEHNGGCQALPPEVVRVPTECWRLYKEERTELYFVEGGRKKPESGLQ